MKKYFKTVIVATTLLLCGCLALIASQLPAHALTPTPVTQSAATQTIIASNTTVQTPTSTSVVATPSPTATPVPTATTTPLPTPSPTVPPAQTPTPRPQPTSTPIPSPTQGAGSPLFPTTGLTPTLQATPQTTPTPTPSPASTTVAATATTVSNDIATDSNNQPNTKSSTTGNSLLLPIGVSAAVLLFLALIIGIVLLKRSNAQPRRTITPRVPLTPTAPATPLPWAFQQQNTAMEQQIGIPVLPQTPVPFAPPALLMNASQTSPALNMTPMSPPPAFFNSDNATIASLTGPLNSFSGKLSAIPAPQGNTSPSAMPPYLGMSPLTETYLPSDLRPMTSALPKQPARQPTGQMQLNPISSDMRPLLPDSFDLTQILGNQAQQANIPALSKTQPALPIVPPSIQDDPVLETIMRQAQMGLYAHPLPSDNLNDFQPGNSSKHSNMFLL